MEEEQSKIEESEDTCNSSTLKSVDSISIRKEENLVTSESILSRINEACNKISSAENENGMKNDSELSSDAEGSNSNEAAKSVNCNGQDGDDEADASAVNDDSLSSTPPDNVKEANNDGDKTSDMETEENLEKEENSNSALQLKISDTVSEKDIDNETTEGSKTTDIEENTSITIETEEKSTVSSEMETKKDASATSEMEVETVKDASATSEMEVETVKDASATSEMEVETEKDASATSEMGVDENKTVTMETETSERETEAQTNETTEAKVSDEGTEKDENSISLPKIAVKNLVDNEGTESDKNKKETGIVKIKLRSFASLCDNDVQTNENSNSGNFFDPSSSSAVGFEVSGVAVGDIVQHNTYVESDECGVMHLKISNVVGGEDCITGLSLDDAGDSLANIQIASITSLIEPLSPESRPDKVSASTSSQELDTVEMSDAGCQTMQKFPNMPQRISLPPRDLSDGLKETSQETVINIFRSPLVVAHSCALCKKKVVCEFRVVCREKTENKISFMCSFKCKEKAVAKFPDSQIVQKPRLFFERVCGMCGKDLSTSSKSKILSWQTREFCDKLCLADHIGEVARSCFYCKSNVRVLYMVKYCVRFGSDVHQFCSNTCLETFKTTIKVCSFCQKNLSFVKKVISPSNKEYCSDKCLKRAQRRDIGQINYKEENDCTVCIKKVVNEYEFIYKSSPTFLCSTPCLNVFKYVNQVKSVNCCLCSRLLNAEDTATFFFNGKQLRVFCTESCFSVFVISARKIVTCHYCKVKKYNFDMIWSMTEDVGEFFYCSVCCLNLVENQNKNASSAAAAAALPDSKPAVPVETTAAIQPLPATEPAASSTPILKKCNMCSKLEPAQFHMVMSDSTLRSFCSYTCATRYKCTFGFQVSGGVPLLESKEEVMRQVQATQTKSVETQIIKPPMVTVPGNKITSKFDLKDAKTLMRLFCPPHLSNKSTMCRPVQNTKGIQCKPHQWHKGCQTDEDSSEPKAIIPVPIPVYVPTPMMMYSAATPVPLIIPVPVPIPIFIPTLEKTTKELEERIKSLLALSKSEVKSSDEEESKKSEVKSSDEEESLKKSDGKSDEKSLKKSEGKSDEEPLKKSEEKLDEEKLSNIKNIKSTDNNDEVMKESGSVEVEELLKLEHILVKFDTISKEGECSKSESGGVKRKLESDSSYSSPKRRKADEDEADDENEEAEVLNLMHGLSVWQSWAQRKTEEDPEHNQTIQQDLSAMSSEDLNLSLIQFLQDLSAQSTKFDVDTVFYILLGLQKYLFEKGSLHCIFLETNFDSFTSVFDEMIEKFFETLAQPSKKCLSGTRVTEEMMWEARQLGAHSPDVLISTLFYFNTKIFKLKSSEDHFKLNFGQISKEGKRTSNSPDGSPVLTMYLKYSSGGDDSNSLKMFENKENPLRCPVKLYEFYLSKCSESTQTNKDTYYVYPEETCMPDSSVWYTMKPLEVSTLNKMLNRVLLVKEVQESLFGS